MNQNEVLTDFLRKRKDRNVAILLKFKDELDRSSQLDARTSQKMRKLVLDLFNDFYNSAIDVVGSLDTGEFVVNQEYLNRLSQMNDKIDAMYERVMMDDESG